MLLVSAQEYGKVFGLDDPLEQRAGAYFIRHVDPSFACADIAIIHSKNEFYKSAGCTRRLPLQALIAKCSRAAAQRIKGVSMEKMMLVDAK